MSLRTARERMIQSLWYEAGGLCLSIPGYLIYSGGTAGESATLMVALSVAVLIWAPLHNAVFDWIDLRLSGRVASDRPKAWRVVHAISLETTVLIVTLPMMVFVGGLGWGGAMVVNLGLTLLYAAYALVFHMIYDRLRPVAVPVAKMTDWPCVAALMPVSCRPAK
jgi:uncharacterized membrane protein